MRLLTKTISDCMQCDHVQLETNRVTGEISKRCGKSNKLIIGIIPDWCKLDYELSEITKTKIGLGGIACFIEYPWYWGKLPMIFLDNFIERAHLLIPDDSNIFVSNYSVGLEWTDVTINCNYDGYEYYEYSNGYAFVAADLDIFIDKLKERLKE